MVRLLFVFFVTFLIVTFSIQGFRALARAEKWQFTKIAACGMMVLAISVAILTAIYILFKEIYEKVHLPANFNALMMK